MRLPIARRHPSVRPAVLTVAGSLLVAGTFAACDDRARPSNPAAPAMLEGHGPDMTMGVGTQASLLGRATFADAFHVKRRTGDWEIDIKAKDPVDVAVQNITFAPGGFSGWHAHPGPVFIQVVSGTITFYDSDDPTCSPIVRTAGQGFLDTGEHAHIARNEGSVPATNVVTYFAPPGAALRIDAPKPAQCPF